LCCDWRGGEGEGVTLIDRCDQREKRDLVLDFSGNSLVLGVVGENKADFDIFFRKEVILIEALLMIYLGGGAC
jgi:hypothetical protein